MEFLSQVQEQLVREQFPSLVNLRTRIHFMYWSELHLVTQELCDQLPFGQIFSATSFYCLIDFQLGSLLRVDFTSRKGVPIGIGTTR